MLGIFNFTAYNIQQMDEATYLGSQKEMQDKYEALCRRCGGCCGAFDTDPCVNLRSAGGDKYYCAVYDHRIGIQKTVSGKAFACVPIRDLKPNLPFKGCAYL